MSVFTASRQTLLPRPILVRFIWEAGWNIGDETLRIADGLTGLVAESGLRDSEVADAYFGLITYLFGFVLAETAAAGHAPFGTTPGHDGEHFPNLVRYGPATDPAGMDRRFQYGLARALEGIKARASKGRRR